MTQQELAQELAELIERAEKHLLPKSIHELLNDLATVQFGRCLQLQLERGLWPPEDRAPHLT